MKIKEAFEIKEGYQTGQEPGLVVVPDTLIAKDPSQLIGRIVTIHILSGSVLELPIDEAKEHGAMNSLFFRRLVREDIPVGCEIAVAPQPVAESTKPSRSIAS